MRMDSKNNIGLIDHFTRFEHATHRALATLKGLNYLSTHFARLNFVHKGLNKK